MAGLTIGAVARAAGVKVPTIRFYEGLGLMPAPPRTEGNRRTYDIAAVRRLQFIRHARELGFAIDAIRTLLALSDRPDDPCCDADHLAQNHLADIESKIDRLIALREEVRRMVEGCARGRIRDCRVIEVLAERDHRHPPPSRLSG
ncbi:MAG: helix-turn-helix domain-containing protein [Bauldia sp.]|nr:helix-turn-helix domain-containing protein [Bauldia sp.]